MLLFLFIILIIIFAIGTRGGEESRYSKLEILYDLTVANQKIKQKRMIRLFTDKVYFEKCCRQYLLANKLCTEEEITNRDKNLAYNDFLLKSMQELMDKYKIYVNIDPFKESFQESIRFYSGRMHPSAFL